MYFACEKHNEQPIQYGDYALSSQNLHYYKICIFKNILLGYQSIQNLAERFLKDKI